MTKYLSISSYIGKPFLVIYDFALHPIPSEFSCIYENFLFFFDSADYQMEHE